MAEKMTEAQGRIAMDLAQAAADRCQSAMMDKIQLCEHPVQVWTVALQVAAMALGAAGGAIKKQRPELSYDESQDAAFGLLKLMLQGPTPSPAAQDREDGR